MTGSRQRRAFARTYQRSWARLCAGTVDTVVADLGTAASGRLLDAGSGTGTLARAAAARGWAVTAVDPDEQMLSVGRQVCDGLQVDWVRSALPRSGLGDGAFDAVVANFVVNNLPDPRAATEELTRVVRPGGLVALTAWVSERTTHIALIEEAFRHAGLPAPRRKRPAEVDFERTVDGLASLAQRSGLHPLRSRELTWSWAISWDDLWPGIVAAMAQPYLDLDATARDDVREALRRRTSALETGAVVHVPTVAAYVLARR
ncbi:class I SAM-dependent methyltransferase [Kineosporia sp. A_224]|uniref:class I SAM-dependent methyltransferase n=1 Tax=Kineosporia sp. A_224 TaxID=1962180 RepID=UPI000B4B2483|nr:class I SAM-dependent methyltransferase [Kineosporia sp. A_224]